MERDAYDIDSASTMAALGDTLASEPGATAAEGDALRLSAERPRYRLRGKLGEGGMGRVDWVWDTDLMRDLAVKRLRDDLSHSSKLVQQFLWEVRVTASLDHPNVIPVYDLGVTPDGYPYFTMKRVGGQSMADLIRRLAAGDAEAVERFTMQRRLRIFMQLCQAVAFAHARGVIHRDLKPDNVMLGEHGEVLVMDWGIALAMGDIAEHPVDLGAGPAVTDGELTGTPMYMAPEQASCATDLDGRADVFSLGAILYELCSLARPYESRGVADLLERVREGKVRPLFSDVSGLSPSLIAVIERAMAHDRRDRYPSVDALYADVERVVDGRTPEAEGVSAAKRLARYAFREDRRLGELRPIQVDLAIGGAMIGGAGIGSLIGAGLRDWAWLAIALGVVMLVPFVVKWVRMIWRRA